MIVFSGLKGNIAFSHDFEEKSFEQASYKWEKPREEGFLQVSELHNIFYAVYGNPKGIPVIVLHGGPGAGCSDQMSESFDLTRWNVVMLDQRGAKRSQPFCCMEENTPQHLVRDIETLRQHLKVDKWVVFGGSWGSSLALLYGQANPERCLGFILRGVWLCREPDYLHLFYGMGKVFPEAYQAVIDYIPESEREDLIEAYYKRVFDPDPKIHLKAARTFMRFDFICATHLPNPKMVETMLENDQLVLSVAKAFLFYAKNQFFLKPNQILSNMEKISHIPAVIIHGRYDNICLPEMAYLLYKSWPNSMLWMVEDGGHSSQDPSISGALVSATDFFAEKLLP